MSYYIKIGDEKVETPKSCNKCLMCQDTYVSINSVATPNQTTSDMYYGIKYEHVYYCPAYYNKVIDDITKKPLWCPIRDVKEKHKEQKWFMCSEKLPKKEGKYIVSGNWKYEPELVWIAEFKKFGNIGGWINEVSNPEIKKWMPLPKEHEEE